MTNTSSIRVLQINLNRSNIATESALQLAIEFNIDLIAVQEPWLIPRQSTNPDYTDVRSVSHSAFLQIFPNNNKSQRPRTMVYISHKKTSRVKLSPASPKDPDIQTFDISDEAGSYQLINLYNQKSLTGQRGKTIEAHLFTASINPKTVIVGDFNLHHRLWEPEAKSSPEADKLAEWIEDNELELVNTPGNGTFYRSNMKNPTTIDLTLATPAIAQNIYDWHTTEEIGSDHFGLLFTIGQEKDNIENPMNQGKFNFRKADWKKFAEELSTETAKNSKLHCQSKGLDLYTKGGVETPPNVVNLLETAAAELTGCILRAAKKSIPHIKQGLRSKPWWSSELKDLRKNMIQAQQTLRCYPEQENVREGYRNARNAYFKTIKNSKQNHWNTFLENEDTKTIFKALSYTKDMRVSKIPPITTPDGSVKESFQGKCEAFRKSLFPVPPLADPPEWGNYEPDPWEWPRLTIHELEQACTGKKSSNTPGPDGITQEMISHAYRAIPETFMKIYSAMINTGFHPKCWKQATGAILKKPSKTDYSQPKAYRVISLLNCLGKVSERIIAKRLGYLAETTELLHPTQIGGRLKKSAIDAALMLTSEIETNRHRNKISSTLFLDIRGAFDHVAKNQLLEVLRKKKLPRSLISWVKSFMDNRSIQLAFDGEKENPQTIETGIPQGSPVSPILFLLYIRDLFKTEKASILSYMDDIAITTSSTSLAKNTHTLENEVMRIWTLGKKNAIEFDLAKTELMHFTKRKEATHRFLTLPNGDRINPKDSIRWLGIWFDPGLKFRIHINTRTSQAIQSFHRMARLANTERGLSPAAMRQIYLACITTIADYGSVVWWKGQDYVREALQKLQNLALKKILGTFKTSPIRPMEVEAALMPPQVRLDSATRKFALRAAKLSPQHPVNQLLKTHRELLGTKITQVKRIKNSTRQLINHKSLEKIKNFYFPPWSSDLPCAIEMLNIPKDIVTQSHDDQIKCTDWQTNTYIYTDASKMEDSTGVGIGIVATNRNGRLENFGSYNIGITNLIFDGELEGIARGTEYASSKAVPGHKFVVFSDSKSALQRVIKIRENSNQERVERIKAALRDINEKRADIKLSWIPAHSKIKGNEKADAVAKSASKKSAKNHQTSLGWLKMQIHKQNKIDWLKIQRDYLEKTGEKASKYYKNFNITINSRVRIPKGTNRETSSAFFQLKLGHGYNKAYLYRIGHAADDRCECGKKQTVEHLLLSCKKYKTEREILKKELNDNKLNLNLLLSTRNGIIKTTQFIQKTKISTRKWYLEWGGVAEDE